MACGNALATACTATFISGSDASFDYLIQSNVITGMKAPLALNKNSGTGAMFGTFTGNTIGASGVAGSGGAGLFVGSQVDGVPHITSIAGNAIFNYSLFGIDVSGGIRRDTRCDRQREHHSGAGCIGAAWYSSNSG